MKATAALFLGARATAESAVHWERDGIALDEPASLETSRRQEATTTKKPGLIKRWRERKRKVRGRAAKLCGTRLRSPGERTHPSPGDKLSTPLPGAVRQLSSRFISLAIRSLPGIHLEPPGVKKEVNQCTPGFALFHPLLSPCTWTQLVALGRRRLRGRRGERGPSARVDWTGALRLETASPDAAGRYSCSLVEGGAPALVADVLVLQRRVLTAAGTALGMSRAPMQRGACVGFLQGSDDQTT